MMKKIGLAAAFWLTLLTTLNAQSYGEIENRFTQEKLKDSDSTAFEHLSIQRANTLLEYSNIYANPSNNIDTRNYVVQRSEEMFRPNTHTGLVYKIGVDSLLVNLDLLSKSFSLGSIPISFVKGSDTFGEIIIGTDPELRLKVILIRSQKSFGNNSKEVWQVFFTYPEE